MGGWTAFLPLLLACILAVAVRLPGPTVGKGPGRAVAALVVFVAALLIPIFWPS